MTKLATPPTAETTADEDALPRISEYREQRSVSAAASSAIKALRVAISSLGALTEASPEGELEGTLSVAGSAPGLISLYIAVEEEEDIDTTVFLVAYADEHPVDQIAAKEAVRTLFERMSEALS